MNKENKNMPGTDDDETVDIAIIGAGIAGCYTSYRLKSEDRLLKREGRQKIVLYEQDDFIGGRLKSIKFGEHYIELGGMRFFEEIPILSDLLRHLNLTSKVKQFDFSSNCNLSYLKKRSVRLDDFELINTLYSLSPDEQSTSAEGLIEFAIKKHFNWFYPLHDHYHQCYKEKNWALVDEVSKQYEDIKSKTNWEGNSIESISWFQFLNAFLSTEAIAFIQDIGGYEIVNSNGNASSWLDNIFYTPKNVQYKCLSSGFNSLPAKLCRDFVKNGGILKLNYKLIAVSKSDDKYLLSFENGKEIKQISTQFLILTVPKPALVKLIDNTSFSKKINKKIFESIKSVNAFKLFLTYPFAWWEKARGDKGRDTTDLPIRQFYYNKFNDKSSTPALIMAAYCNGPDVIYWNDLINDTKQSCLEKKMPNSEDYYIKEELKRVAHVFLTEAIGIMNAPLPIDVFYELWLESQGRPGWHVWDKGYSSEKSMDYMRQPFPKEKVYIVGESWAKEPGSVQGALETSEKMLQNNLGLSKPNWLKTKFI
ncbi:flavin monoamine oxidase family protein [Chitinophaga polysaccharea]|uniref:flavin monoamine oxidase family protein n=1 Tax=Chitinophaga polysaccharea TaxID=1293035 RepID=UPI00115A88F1|nr:FAD-dependent oxidoreductase [Chitinophaga polysaccharea]